jgi:hypothetical protein
MNILSIMMYVPRRRSAEKSLCTAPGGEVKDKSPASGPGAAAATGRTIVPDATVLSLTTPDGIYNMPVAHAEGSLFLSMFPPVST